MRYEKSEIRIGMTMELDGPPVHVRKSQPPPPPPVRYGDAPSGPPDFSEISARLDEGPRAPGSYRQGVQEECAPWVVCPLRTGRSGTAVEASVVPPPTAASGSRAAFAHYRETADDFGVVDARET